MKFLDWFRRSKDKKTVTKESNANKLSKYNENLQLQLIGLRIGLGMTQEEFAELTGAELSLIRELDKNIEDITVGELQTILTNTNTGARLVIKKRDDKFTRFYDR